VVPPKDSSSATRFALVDVDGIGTGDNISVRRTEPFFAESDSIVVGIVVGIVEETFIDSADKIRDKVVDKVFDILRILFCK